MNPQNQKPENTNPDLDFIRNTNDPLEAPVKKGLDKKIIVIIVLVVITLVIMVVGMLTGANKKVQKSKNSSSSNNATTVSSETQTKAKDVVVSFLEYVSDNNTVDAFSLYSLDSGISQADFDTQTMRFLKTVDIESCEASEAKTNYGVVDNEGRILQIYKCKYKSSDGEVGLMFHVQSNASGSFSIYGFDLVRPA